MPGTILDQLQRHVLGQENRTAFIFLENGERETHRRSFGELNREALRHAHWITDSGIAGKPILLLLDGIAFIEAFLGCLYAGAIPVPAFAPRSARRLHPLRAIAADAGVVGVLTSAKQAEWLQPALQPDLHEVRWYCVENNPCSGDDWEPPALGSDQVAFIQYTSGSTGAPKGVVVTHGCLAHNEAVVQRSMGLSETSAMVSWLPLYHDMGLIGNVLQPLYAGFLGVLMSPAAFLQKPLRWLEAMSRYGGTMAGAPNFAYDLCVDRTSPEQRKLLDLSRWDVVYCGSEPVRAATIDRFVTAFAPAGLKRTSFFPCYGMAESTLFVTGVGRGNGPAYLKVDAEGLSQGRVEPVRSDAPSHCEIATLVSCGVPSSDMTIAIVNPETHRACPENVVGEIWVNGPSVCSGYYRRPDATRETFEGVLNPPDGKRYLRTGDLGFSLNSQLFITGRVKDVIIVRGKNHYPQDLEWTAERSNPMLTKGGAVAVPMSRDGKEDVAVVVELTREGWRTADVDAVIADIREAIAAEHGILPGCVTLIMPGTMPRTTSGKVRRSACRTLLETGGLADVRRGEVAQK